MQNIKKISLLTEKDYLSGEEFAQIRHEYVAGQIYAMAGATERHNLVSLNLAVHFRTATRGGTCRVFINDMKLRIQERPTFYYPDVMLCCDHNDNHELYKEHPCLIAEVLSPSTETIDRREKLLAYQTIPSLHYYLIVAANQKQIDYYQRADDGSWYSGLLDANSVLEIKCLGCQIVLCLEDCYQDVQMP